jgi:hypothetical protein
MKIYIVLGSCGEYDDHCEWLVRAYTCRACAEKHVIYANKRTMELYKEYQYPKLYHDQGEDFDAKFQLHYDTEYRIEEMELEEKP